MFNTMVLPHLDYCCTIWRTASDTNIGKLQKIQNRGMRIIWQCHPRTHIADMLLNLKWLSINPYSGMRICHICIVSLARNFVQKYKKNDIFKPIASDPIKTDEAKTLYTWWHWLELGFMGMLPLGHHGKVISRSQQGQISSNWVKIAYFCSFFVVYFHLRCLCWL